MDLDQTLIFTTTLANKEKDDHILKFHNPPEELAMKVRPYSYEFLKEMDKYFEIIAFTTATPDYAR